MSQDTRKDKRARDINVVVRYKSATVDEFIENHSFDISRGGAFIKTNNPFPPGTLLKFELRLAANEKVVSGVGRVVWKREAAQGTPQNPAGMGVKFIKIDDSSKVVIDNLVAQNPSAGGAFEAVAPMPSSPPPAGEPRVAATSAAGGPPASLPRPAPPHRTSRTIAGMPTPMPETNALSGAGASGVSPPPGKAAPGPVRHDTVDGAFLAALEENPQKMEPATAPRATFASRKATLMGISVAPPAPTPASAISEPPPAPAPGSGRPEPTVMKQAAELLAEALKEAGGSMEEIEGNPLFENLSKHGDGDGAPASDRNSPPSLRIPNEGEEEIPTRVVSSSDMNVDPSGATEPMEKQQSGDTMTLSAKAVRDAEEARQRGAATAPPSRMKASPAVAAATAKPVEKKGGSGGIVLVLGILILAAGGGFFAWKTGIIGGKPATIPSNTPSVVVPIETASATAMPTATASAVPSVPATAGSALPTTTASASASAAASAAPTATAAPTAPVPVIKPIVTAAPPKPVTPPKPTGDGTDPAPPATAAAPKATATATAAPAPAPVPVAPPPDELK